MKVLRVGLLLWVVVLPVLAQDKPRPNHDLLRQKLSAHIARPRFASALWGIKIVSLDSGETLFAHNADLLLKPASNAKLFTGALALDRLGPDYRIKTSVFSTRSPNRQGTLRGDLILYGRGDPSMAARFNDGDDSRSLEPLAQALRASGLKRVRGKFVADESYFSGPPFGSGWTWDDLEYYYGARVSALTLDDNVIEVEIRPGSELGAPCLIQARPNPTGLIFNNRTTSVTNGSVRRVTLHRPLGENIVYVHGQMPLDDPGAKDSVTVDQPARWFGQRLREVLTRGGIAVSGQIQTRNWLDRETDPIEITNLVELCSIESRPLNEILTRMMKPSQNLYAQLLLLQVGARSSLPRGLSTTEDLGLLELRAFLKEIGVKANSVLLEEGSGLSRGCLVTPDAIVALLRHMDQHRFAEAYRASLPIAGVDGTLRRRFVDTPAMGKVQAKTGTLRYVNTLSGYAVARDGERLVFSFMLNNYKPPENAGGIREDLDPLVLALLGEP